MAIDEDTSYDYEEEIRRRIMEEKERTEVERLRERELEEESVKLDHEIEQEIRGTLHLKAIDASCSLYQRRIDGGRKVEHSYRSRIPRFCRAVLQDRSTSLERQLRLHPGLYHWRRGRRVSIEESHIVHHLTTPSDESEGRRVKKVCEFFDEHLGKNRSITDIDWSPKVRTPHLTKI